MRRQIQSVDSRTPSKTVGSRTAQLMTALYESGEAYRFAAIAPGRVGPDQAEPGKEFERDMGALWRDPGQKST